ncbi:hypothetical protein BDZ97DRAFT_1806687 [Flammula alnicola]|nr:hypothetical protein BDZ97DRAFT_1806687 [Flammula alnicola]
MYLYSEEYIVASNFLTATASVLVWELIITLDDEINYIWQQPWTLGTILFAVNRYLPFVDTFMALYLQMTVTTQEMCRSYYTAITWIVAIGLMVSELIILLRTWALWQRKRIIFFILGGMSTLTFGPGIAVTSLEIKSLRFGDTPLGGRGCKLEEASKTILVAYALIALSETVVVTLTVIRGMDHLRSSSRSSWVTRVYGYGLLFYIYLLSG